MGLGSNRHGLGVRPGNRATGGGHLEEGVLEVTCQDPRLKAARASGLPWGTLRGENLWMQERGQRPGLRLPVKAT